MSCAPAAAATSTTPPSGERPPLDTETAASYARRRLGPELAEYLVQPLMRTMMVADADRVSKVQLLSGLANAFGGTWLAPANGAGALVKALSAELKIHTRSEVTRIERTDDAVRLAGARTGRQASSMSSAPRSSRAHCRPQSRSAATKARRSDS
jgi:phytoene dehydrogenase-like protein